MLEELKETPEVESAREAMVNHPRVQALVADLADWPGYPLKRHNDAKHPLHKLVFLADLGVKAGDPGIDPVIQRVLSHQSNEGPFQIKMQLYKRFGGLEGEHDIWMACDAPLVVYALARLSLAGEPEVKAAANHLTGLVRDNGWPCAASPLFGGKFKGPGRREDPCPYANLVMLKALSALPGGIEEPAAKAGIEALLNNWENRRERKPFLFGMGTDFVKLKAPLIWYDLLHVLDVLSRYPIARDDPRVQEMARLLAAKSDDKGRFTPESIWMAWRGWDFGQKKDPSPWITLLAHRILQRLGS